MMLLNLLLIALVCVLIIDISGFVDTIKSLISKLLTNSKFNTTNFRIRPFDCSFCMTFWVGLVYILVTQQFTLVTLALILIMSFITEPLHQLLLLIKDLILKIINYIYDRYID